MNLDKIENLPPKPLNTLKNEHLNEGIPSIVGCIYDKAQMGDKDKTFFDNFKKSAVFVDYKKTVNQIDLLREGHMSAGKKSYVISRIDNQNKYSNNYLDCTGFVCSGIDKRTGENMSFLVHLDPNFLLMNNNENKIKFRDDLNRRLDEMNSICKQGSIDVGIFGGNKGFVLDTVPDEDFKNGVDNEFEYLRSEYSDYADSIHFLDFIISKRMNFSPTVLIGPSNNFKSLDKDLTESKESLAVYFDNKNRRLYEVRPENDLENNESFLAKDVEEQIKKIKSKEEERKK
jgi:hypothetical protein